MFIEIRSPREILLQQIFSLDHMELIFFNNYKKHCCISPAQKSIVPVFKMSPCDDMKI